jgi:hypothetical protein
MAHPQLTDGGEGLQVFMEVTNILYKQSLTAFKVWFVLMSCMGLAASHRRRYFVMASVHVHKIQSIAELL